MENMNTNATTPDQPEEQKSIMDGINAHGQEGFKDAVIDGVQHYIDIIQDAINPLNDDDLPLVTAALKIYRDSMKKELGPYGEKLDKLIRETVRKSSVVSRKKVYVPTAICAKNETDAAEIVKILKKRPNPQELEKALTAIGYHKEGDEWVKNAGSEEAEEVD